MMNLRMKRKLVNSKKKVDLKKIEEVVNKKADPKIKVIRIKIRFKNIR